ncbi:hypothetical protein [Kitasatospora griseola]
MIALARTMYNGHLERRPGELLDTARFSDPEAIEEHLLAGFVPAIYCPVPPNGSTPPAAGPARGTRNAPNAGSATSLTT